MQSYARYILFLTEAALVFLCAGILFNVAPDTVHAATVTKPKFEISGWIPYWRTATGTADVLPRLSQLTEINPFGYTVKNNGELYDAMNVNDPAWQNLFAAARAQHVRIMPTVMWSDTESMDTVLKDPSLRAAHVAAIVAMVNQNNFDGVDIDYEGKKASDMPYFSAFLKQLYAAMGRKFVSCTIEARTPPSSVFAKIPTDLQYANDYTAINKYCDRVKLMTYDQETVDLKLNASNALYTPIADPAWVTKVVNLAAQKINKSKLIIGVATYGYEYQVMPSTDGSSYSYDLLSAFNPRYATELAASLGITPTRNSAGELSFTYVPASLSAAGLPSQSQLSSYAPANTPTSLLAAIGAIQYAKTQSKQSPFYLEWWSDSKAIADKVALAKKLGVRGVAVFKMDGGEDPNMWSVLK